MMVSIVMFSGSWSLLLQLSYICHCCLVDVVIVRCYCCLRRDVFLSIGVVANVMVVHYCREMLAVEQLSSVTQN